MTFIKKNWLIFLILFLAFVLRFYHLGRESLFWDELDIINNVNVSDLRHLFSQQILHEFNPPLYYVFLHFYLGIVGFSDITARIPSAIFGGFSVLIMYSIGKLMFSRKVGLFSAFLLATSAFSIFYSQSARMYSMLLFFSLLSIFFFLRLLTDPKTLNWFLYILASIFMIYSQSFGFVILIIQNIFILLYYRKSNNLREFNIKKWVLSQVIITVAFSSWLNIFYHQAILIKDWHPWGISPPLYADYFTDSLIEFSGSRLIFTLFALFFLIIISNLFLKLTRKKPPLADKETESQYLGLAILLFIFPLIIPVILSFFLTPNLCYVRYAVLSSIGVILLISHGVFRFRNKIILTGLIFLVVVSNYLVLRNYYSITRFNQWKEATLFIQNQAELNSSILFSNYHGMIAFGFYSNRSDLSKISIEGSDFSKIKDNFSGQNQVWLINSTDDIAFWWTPLSQKVGTPDETILPEGLVSLFEKKQSFAGVDIYKIIKK